jgi:siroheme synthase-like protein
MKSLYPIFLKLDRRPVLIAGGGEIALGKVRGLIPCGARLTVVASQVHPELAALALEHGIALHQRPFREADLDGQALVFAATNDVALNRRIVEWAEARGILSNPVDDPEYGGFFSAAVVRRAPFVIAVGTEGRFPGLTRALREALDRWLPEALGDAADRLSALREALRTTTLPNQRKSHALRELRAWFTREYLTPQENRPS